MACVMFVRVSRIEFAESDVSRYRAIIFANGTKRGRGRARGRGEDAIVFRFHRVLAGWLTRHLSPRTKPLEFEWNPAKVGRKWRFSVAYFFPCSSRKKKKKKNASRSWRGEDSIFRPLRRGLTGCNGEPLRWRDEAKHLLTYLLTTEETTKKLHALTRSRAMLVKSSLR